MIFILTFLLVQSTFVSAIFVPHSSSDGLESILPLHNFTATGQLFCQVRDQKPKPIGGVVEVWEEDSWNADDLITQVNTSTDGKFEFRFLHHEIGEVSPYLWVRHCCTSSEQKSNKPCGQTWTHKFSEPPHNQTLNLVVVIEAQPSPKINSTMPPSGDPKKPKKPAN